MLSPDSYRDRLSIGSVEPEKKHFFVVFLIYLWISIFIFTEIEYFNVTRWL